LKRLYFLQVKVAKNNNTNKNNNKSIILAHLNYTNNTSAMFKKSLDYLLLYKKIIYKLGKTNNIYSGDKKIMVK